MLQILTKVFGILASNDKNAELHHTTPQVWATGHYGKAPHFLLTNSYLSEYLIILVCSFIDEYNNHFIPSKSDILGDRIHLFRQKISPVMKKINKWDGLQNYRNTILAHNLRIKGKTPVLSNIENNKTTFNIPNTHDEILLLGELVALITKNIGVEFPELLPKINFNDNIANQMIIPHDIIDFKKEFESIGDSIKKLGLTYTQRTYL